MNRQLSFKGTHREIGEQVGQQYKAWGKKEVWIPPFASDYYSSQLKIYNQHYPQYIEYLKGIAKGSNIPEHKVLLSFLTGFLPLAQTTPVHKCSVFVLKNQNGILIGRNYDWLGALEKISSLLNYKFTDSSTNSFIGITDMATCTVGKLIPTSHFVIMTDDGWNEYGLYIAVNSAPGIKSGLGLCHAHLVQSVLEKCKETNEAIGLMDKIPIESSKIFTIADKKGNFAVVEKPIDEKIRTRFSKELIFTTNHYNHPDLTNQNLEIFKTIPYHSTFARYQYLQLNLEKDKDKLDIKSIISLMSKPPVRQNWRGIINGDSMTIWTYGLNLSTGKYIIDFAPIIKDRVRIEN